MTTFWDWFWLCATVLFLIGVVDGAAVWVFLRSCDDPPPIAGDET